MNTFNIIHFQAGGATTENVFSAAMTSILDALKSTDWITRKAASVALAAIAANGVSYLSSFKSKCIHSLDGCRFDKVCTCSILINLFLHFTLN